MLMLELLFGVRIVPK